MLCNKIRSGVICLILTVTAFFMAGFTGSAKAKGEHMKKALIVYGSFMGSTIEVANAVKEELEKAGFAVDARAAGENVPDMSGYSVFSRTLDEQNKVANLYRKKMNEMNIH